MTDIPTLETARLRLRPLSWDDQDALVDTIFSDRDVMEHLPGIGPAENLDEQQLLACGYISAYSEPWNGHGYGGWAVCISDPQLGPIGQLIGFCGFTPEKMEGIGPELGYGIGKAWWGKGIATEAATAGLDWIFSQESVSRVYAVIDSGHEESGRVLEKLGMVHRDDVDLYDSVAGDAGLLPFYSVDLDNYIQLRKTQLPKPGLLQKLKGSLLPKRNG